MQPEEVAHHDRAAVRTEACLKRVSQREARLGRGTKERLDALMRGAGDPAGAPVARVEDNTHDCLSSEASPPLLLPASFDFDEDRAVDSKAAGHWRQALTASDALGASSIVAEVRLPSVQEEDVQRADQAGSRGSERLRDTWEQWRLSRRGDAAHDGDPSAPPASAADHDQGQGWGAASLPEDAGPAAHQLPRRTATEQLAREAFDPRAAVLRPDGTGWVTFPGAAVQEPGLYLAMYVCTCKGDRGRQHSVGLARSTVVSVVPPVLRPTGGLACLPPPDPSIPEEIPAVRTKFHMEAALDVAQAVGTATLFGEPVSFRLRCAPLAPGSTAYCPADRLEQASGWVRDPATGIEERHLIRLYRAAGPEAAYVAAEAARRLAVWTDAAATDRYALPFTSLEGSQNLTADAFQLIRAARSAYNLLPDSDDVHDRADELGAARRLEVVSQAAVCSFARSAGLPRTDGSSSFSPHAVQLSRAPRPSSAPDDGAATTQEQEQGASIDRKAGQSWIMTVRNGPAASVDSVGTVFRQRADPISPIDPGAMHDRAAEVAALARVGEVKGQLGGLLAPPLPGIYRLGYAVERRRIGYVKTDNFGAEVQQLSLPFVVLGPYLRLHARMPPAGGNAGAGAGGRSQRGRDAAS